MLKPKPIQYRMFPRGCLFLFFTCLFSFGFNACLGQETTLYFDLDQARLTPQARQTLQGTLDDLSWSLERYSIDINGHTDSLGSLAYNQKLAERRVQGVSNFLLKAGAKQEQIVAQGLGELQPISAIYLDSGCAENRRVVIKFKVGQTHDWALPVQKFKIDLDREVIIQTKNGCRLTIDSGAFVTRQGSAENLELQVVEYNDPADYIASGIPMSYVSNEGLFSYHSHQMFQVQGYQDGFPIALKPHRKIRVSCAFVDTSYQVGFYEFKTEPQSWLALEQPEVTTPEPLQEEETAIEFPAVTSSNSTKMEDKSDEVIDASSSGTNSTELLNEIKLDSTGNAANCQLFCGNLKTFLEAGIEAAQKPLAYHYDFAPCLPLLDRLTAHDFIGLEAAHEVLDTTAYQVELKTSFWSPKLTLVDAGVHQHLEPLEGITFKYKKSRAIRKQLKKEKHTHFFPALLPNDSVKLYFQHQKNPLQIEAFLSENSTVNQKKIKALDTFRKNFDQEVNRTCVETANTLYNQYACIYHATNFLSPETHALTYSEWLGYFDAHRSSLANQFKVALTQLDSLETVFCQTHVGDTLSMKIRRTKGNNPVLLIGLGIYNYDEVIPLQNPIPLNLNHLQNAQGKIIQLDRAFLVLEGINGLVNCGKQPVYVPGYQNKLLAIDKAGKRYFAVIEKLEQMQKFRDVTEGTMTLEGLKVTLGF